MPFPSGAVAFPTPTGTPGEGWNHIGDSFPSFYDAFLIYGPSLSFQLNDGTRLLGASWNGGVNTNTWEQPLYVNAVGYGVLASPLPTGWDDGSSSVTGEEMVGLIAHLTTRFNSDYPQDEGVAFMLAHFKGQVFGSYNSEVRFRLKSPHTSGQITLNAPFVSSQAFSISTTGTHVTVNLAISSFAVTTTGSALVAAILADATASAVLTCELNALATGSQTFIEGNNGTAALIADDAPCILAFLANNAQIWSQDGGQTGMAVYPLDEEPAGGWALGYHIHDGTTDYDDPPVGATCDVYLSKTGDTTFAGESPRLSITYVATDNPASYGVYDPGAVGVTSHHIVGDYRLWTEVGAGEADTGTITVTPSGGIVLGGSATKTRTVAATKSGGIVLGGTASKTRAVAKTPSGGLVLGGSASATKTITKTSMPSGGLVLGGSTTKTRTVARTASGGVVLGGSAAQARTVARTTSGGVVLGGSASQTRTVARTAAGGLVLGGSASQARTIARTASGGLVLGGTATVTRTAARAVSGGVVLGGSATYTTSGTISVSVSGGVVLGGSAAKTRTIAPTVAGGIVLGGSATQARSFARSTSGGIALGGAATYSSHTGLSFIVNGGVVLGGSTSSTVTRAKTASGGIVLGGAASQARTIARSSSGGLVLGGAAAATVTRTSSPSGGIVLGGTCTVTRATSRTASGGLVLGGSITARSLTRTVSGGLRLGGTVVVVYVPGTARSINFSVGALTLGWGAGRLRTDPDEAGPLAATPSIGRLST